MGVCNARAWASARVSHAPRLTQDRALEWGYLHIASFSPRAAYSCRSRYKRPPAPSGAFKSKTQRSDPGASLSGVSSPGPGAYIPPSAFKTEKKKAHLQFFGSSSSRFDDRTLRSAGGAPGPGTYKLGSGFRQRSSTGHGRRPQEPGVGFTGSSSRFQTKCVVEGGRHTACLSLEIQSLNAHWSLAAHALSQFHFAQVRNPWSWPCTDQSRCVQFYESIGEEAHWTLYIVWNHHKKVFRAS